MEEDTFCELRLTTKERNFLSNAIWQFREEHGHQWRDDSHETAQDLLRRLGIESA